MSSAEPQDIDWDALRAAAREAMRYAYVPYSNFPVGAAALVDDGRIVTGCNVENASYGVGLCAECGLVTDLARTGGGKLVAFTCCDGNGNRLMPCGRCRQLLNEFAAANCLFDTLEGITGIDGILPMAFGPTNLDDYADTRA